jgi:hypothetical protein
MPPQLPPRKQGMGLPIIHSHVVSAGLRLISMGQQEGQTLLTENLSRLPEAVDRIFQMTDQPLRSFSPSSGYPAIRNQGPSGGRPAIQRNHAIVESGAELQLYLEPVIPFTDSILRQTTQIDIESGGSLMFWEAFMAGRVGRGERWQFQELASETQLLLNGVSTYLDRFRLPNGLQTSSWTMTDCSYLGTGLYVGDQASNFAIMLHEKLPKAGVDTPVPEVAVTRVASNTGPDFHHSREVFCFFADEKVSQAKSVPMNPVR